MWRVTLRGLLAHKVRYALTALAVLLGVAFMAGTFVFTDTIKHTFDGLFSDVYSHTSAVVRAKQPFTPGTNFTSQRRLINADIAARVRQVPGVADISLGVEGYAQLVGRDGKAIGNPAAGAPTLGEAWTAGADQMQPYRFTEGRPPRTSNEVAIDKHSADVGDLTVGDRVTVLTKQRPRQYTISGIVRWGTADSPLGASITLFDLVTAERVLATPGHVAEIDVAAAPGVSQEEMARRLESALHRHPGLEVVTGAKVIEEGQTGIHKALAFLDTFLLVFAGVALFVGSFLIFNTFSIVVAQRMRELALLRAVGAGRAQVIRSVLGESLLIGIAASVAGLGVGIGLAVGLKAMLAVLGFAIPSSGLVVTVRTVLASLVVGVVICLAAALVPAWKAGKVAPVAALREVEVDEEPHAVRRALSGAAVLAVGAGLLLVGLFADVPRRMTYVGAGAAAFFIGIAVAGPVIARPLCRVVGAPLSWGGTGRIARYNAMRNPKRTSASAAALMIGVALVTLISVMAASTKSSISAIVDSAMRADFVVSGGGQPGGQSGFSPTLARRLAALPQVASATGIRSGAVRIDGANTVVIAADPRHVNDLFDIDPRQGDLATMGPTGIAISQQVADADHLAVGDRLPVTFSTTGTRVFTVRVIYGARAAVTVDYLLPLAAAKRNFSSQLDFQVYARLAPGVSAATARTAIERVLSAYPNAILMDRTQYKHEQEKQIDQLLGLMYGLLGLALVIALIGIANTLALSIYERTHELGLLRAVGMTRRQLRGVIRGESVIIALLGTVEGLAVGILLGWAVVTALRPQGVTRLSLPLTQLAVVAVLAGLAGVVAAMGPAHRAARLDVLRAISRH